MVRPVGVISAVRALRGCEIFLNRPDERPPRIIFIDERSRMSGAFGGYDEKEQTLNQLLAELDGFDPSTGVILIAATKRPEVLDPALLRHGRFDRQVLVDRADRTVFK